HCHSTVRSLYSSPKQTPWSHPYSRPSATGSRWPILRSALLTTASKTAMSRSSGWSRLRARATRSASASASIQSWHMPGPNGPSRITVGGTRCQPAARDTEYAATSRPASVPRGKSHSGRSPATGLYTQAAVSPRSRTVQYKVAFEAATRRPSTFRLPSDSRSSAGWSSHGPVGGGEVKGTAPGRRFLRGGRGAGRSPGSSGITHPVPVLPRADVPLGVQRQPAQRARRAALPDDLDRALGERPRRPGGQPHPQHPGTVLRPLLSQRLGGGLGLLLRLDHHFLVFPVPAARPAAPPHV